MTTLTKISFFVATYFLVIMISPGYAHQGEAAAPLRFIPSEPHLYQLACSKPLSIECANGVYRSVFGNEKMTNVCCAQVVKIGRDCYNGVVKFYASPNNGLEIYPKSKQIFDTCVSITKPNLP
ncbi:Protein of unknown function (DUF784) [Melia azedarach]|uniref:Uncharacterized protein n=1 Tax=Melia azedarach TaxID=155640 RepID=A0ACC1X4H3_MELAZ|nr:Protein of unknown function (DUF784) [Melia azedarach]